MHGPMNVKCSVVFSYTSILLVVTPPERRQLVADFYFFGVFHQENCRVKVNVLPHTKESKAQSSKRLPC